MYGFIKDNIVVGVVILFMLVIAYFGATSFFELTGDLYSWLDNYMWAFFAGIIAFFLALWLVVVMFQITIAVFAFGIAGIVILSDKLGWL